MGDGVLAYFGWPRAHEDESERAVRAGLAVTHAISRLRTPAVKTLMARVGIATGLVVVGDLVGEGAAQEQAVVGDTPNLAARLQERQSRAWCSLRRRDPPPPRRSALVLRGLEPQAFKGPRTDTRLRGGRGARNREPVCGQADGRRRTDRRPPSGACLTDRALAAGQERRRADGPAQR